jgi:hypothetical protein
VEFEAGPITVFLEASATAVGVGMVLGGFAVGLAGVLMGVPRDHLEHGALKAGYIVAAFCLVMRWADIVATI